MYHVCLSVQRVPTVTSFAVLCCAVLRCVVFCCVVLRCADARTGRRCCRLWTMLAWGRRRWSTCGRATKRHEQLRRRQPSTQVCVCVWCGRQEHLGLARLGGTGAATQQPISCPAVHSVPACLCSWRSSPLSCYRPVCCLCVCARIHRGRGWPPARASRRHKPARRRQRTGLRLLPADCAAADVWHLHRACAGWWRGGPGRGAGRRCCWGRAAAAAGAAGWC
jgi:hypothetical protein